ncbi:MAG: DUF262 domain-containing protein [Oscillospiraceae bacterium]|nr:DUF262 domain-containing protein [Oscillospiraceae bacterium]
MATNHQPPIRTGLLDFFRNSSGCQFVIPVYQRNYTWTAGKEVKQYLEDLRNVLDGEYDNHFLGIMIYLDTPIDFSAREFSVIDGQQRLTTTFLTLYAIKELLHQQGEEGQISSLEGQFLTNPYSTAKMKYKLKPMVSDDEVYRLIVENKIDEIDNKNSNVYKNYIYIIDYLKNIIDRGKTINDILMAMNKLYVVCVPISEEDNAQKIFESINATGVKLTASDLIRNFILMDLPSDIQEDYYANYWRKIEEYISNDSKKLELFFRMFLAVKNLSLPSKNEIYRLFVKWFKDSNKTTKEVLEEIVTYADAYYTIYKKDLKKVDSNLRDALKEYRRILSDMPAPALMEFYLLCKNGKISEPVLRDTINIINTYLIRRSLCNLDTSSITRMFPTLLKDVLEECNGNYINIIEILKKYLIAKNVVNAMYMPDDVQMKELMYNANMYNLRSTLRIVFDKIEHKDNPAPVDLNSVNVEHLMPQTPTKEWLETLEIDLDTYQKNVHRLGNLTLAAKIDNSAMGNKVWEYKNKLLKETNHLNINKEVLDAEKWTISEIEKRTDNLIEQIIKVYPYPKINNDILIKEEIYIRVNGIVAKAFFSLDDGSVEIDTGSQLYKFENVENYPDIEDIRQELFDDGIIAEIDGVLQFVKPYIIYSRMSNYTALSMAASIILHSSRSGWAYWENAEGKLIRDIPEIRNKFS